MNLLPDFYISLLEHLWALIYTRPFKLLQFTSSGHTEVRVNAIMITSTVIVVLFSTMVSMLYLIIILNSLHSPAQNMTLIPWV